MAQVSRTSGSAVATAPDEERIVAPRRPSSLLVAPRRSSSGRRRISGRRGIE
ncbi:hypothetical protein DO65_6075 [Burkholderia pseudomallei]|nr:hypothetical protein DO65_6075 [Burkholderia pseudomallei]